MKPKEDTKSDDDPVGGLTRGDTRRGGLKGGPAAAAAMTDHERRVRSAKASLAKAQNHLDRLLATQDEAA